MNYINQNFTKEVNTHRDYTDVSFYEDKSKIKKMPIWCDVQVEEDLYQTDNGSWKTSITTQPHKLDGYFGLYNSSLDKVLQTRPVSSTYQLIPHHELFSEQAKILSQSDLPLDNITVVDQLYKDGLQAHRIIYFHDLEKSVGEKQDKVLCRIDIFNSCDMSWSFQVFSGAYRDLCRNTMTKASIGLEHWTSQSEQMDKWSTIPMNIEQFGNVLKETICKKKGKSAELNLTNPVNETKLNYLLDRFEKETPNLGNTMWAGYNALTHWSTHTDETIEKTFFNKEKGRMDIQKIRSGKSTADKPSVQRTRNDEVRSVIECESWKTLEVA